MELIALYVHPKNSNHLRSHLRAIMALDRSRLGLENKFLENKSGRFFCVRQVYVIKSCQPIRWRGTSFLYFLYIASEPKQHTMRRCFYHTGLRQNARYYCISQFCKTNCTHSIFRTIEARVGFQRERSKISKITCNGQPVLTFDKRQI